MKKHGVTDSSKKQRLICKDGGVPGILGAVSYYPTKSFILEVYGDWNDNTGGSDWYTIQGFVAYKSDNATVGLQFGQQTRQVIDGEVASC